MEEILGYNYELVDITDEFTKACKELEDSEFAKHCEFKLSQAMSAVELMDPKMDSGMQPIERKVEKFSVQKLAGCTFGEFIAIFDASLAMLTSWINCQPLDQTIFTNMCLLKPEILRETMPHLYAMSVSILYALDLFKLFIGTASVAHEEDICTFFGTSHTPAKYSSFSDLPGKYSKEYAEQFLRSSMDTINKEMKEERFSNEELPKLEALNRRFEFLLALFELFHFLLPSTSSLQNNSVERFAPDFRKSNNSLAKCVQLINKLIPTISLGSQPPATVDGAPTSDGDFSWLGDVFDKDAYLYLSPPGFPRRPKLHSRAEAYDYIENLLDKMAQMISSTQECTSESVDTLMNILRRFGQENSSILSRSILQLILMPNDHMICGTVSLGDIIMTSMNRSSGLVDGAGAEEILKTYFAIEPSTRDRFDQFLSLLVRAFIGLFQTFGSNLARQQEKMLPINFDDFGTLTVEAAKMEAQLEMLLIAQQTKVNSKPQTSSSSLPGIQHIFSNFLLQTVLQMMHYHFVLSFRLRLFLPYEFTYIYWYFGEIVARSLTNLSERICSNLIMEFSKNEIHNQKRISGKRLQQKTRMDKHFRIILGRYKKHSIFYRVQTLMALAMFKFTAGLIASRQLSVPPRQRLRYQKRMDSFSPLPNMLFYTYEEYLKESRILELLGRPHPEVFAEAAHLFGEAVEIVKELGEEEMAANNNGIAELQRVAKQNCVVARLMATQQLTKKICFDFCLKDQPCFPLISMK